MLIIGSSSLRVIRKDVNIKYGDCIIAVMTLAASKIKIFFL